LSRLRNQKTERSRTKAELPEAIEIEWITISEEEYSKRIGLLLRALLEIDEVLFMDESDGEPEEAA
jgi:hypothetical protein